MTKVVKAPPKWKDGFWSGYRHWKPDENGIVHDLSPDDWQFVELQGSYGLEVVDLPDDQIKSVPEIENSDTSAPPKQKGAKTTKSQEDKEG